MHEGRARVLQAELDRFVDIVAFNANPSLDRTVLIPDFAAGTLSRVPRILSLAGGKAFNVARALRTLGVTSTVVAPLGGPMGDVVSQLARAEGLLCAWVAIAGATRTCLTIVDPATRRLTEIYEAGPELRAGEWEHIVADLLTTATGARLAVVCGSFLPGAPPHGLRDIVERLTAAGVPVAVDTYGVQLAQALAARPALVKINAHEAAELVGREADEPAAALAAATEIQARGARSVAITLGARGAVGIDADGRRFAWAAPRVSGLYTVGSGDSFFAGLVAALGEGQSLADAARLGIAAGAANTEEMGAAVLTRARVEEMRGQARALSV